MTYIYDCTWKWNLNKDGLISLILQRATLNLLFATSMSDMTTHKWDEPVFFLPVLCLQHSGTLDLSLLTLLKAVRVKCSRSSLGWSHDFGCSATALRLSLFLAGKCSVILPAACEPWDLHNVTPCKPASSIAKSCLSVQVLQQRPSMLQLSWQFHESPAAHYRCFPFVCRWSSLLSETTFSTGTILSVRMNLFYWRSDRHCRMPSCSSAQGIAHTHTRIYALCWIRSSFCFVIVNSFKRSKEVDWQPYFTTRLVDDFATHLRVFRKAQDRLADREDKQSKLTLTSDLRSHTY